ncbi:cytochrome c3 family protein [Candidatus Sumerlaeota bacterium]|nr:cytochrome c3 family protein [Candidatus Sumerlaeota bacterium]
MADSVHGRNGVACDHCHTQADEVPHPKQMSRYTCSDCHKNVARQYKTSVHGQAREQQITEAATCIDCHGGHDMRERTDPRSRTHASNVKKTCLRCHTNEEMAARFGFTRHETGQAYGESVHGRLIAAGHAEASTCNDCHGSHDILPSKDKQSLVNRANIPRTCGRCHWVVLDQYKKSIHFQQFSNGSPDVPVCNDCHQDHRVAPAKSDVFKLAVVSNCGNCHQELLKSYRFSYHGKVTQLGGTTTARCSSCHGSHDILPPTNPQSRLATGKIITTCKLCHSHSNEKFVRFITHLDPGDPRHPQTYYPWLFMTALLGGTIGFFLIHSILWLIRETADLLKRKPRLTVVENPSSRYVHRLNIVHRLCHALLFVSVIGLALTGLPLRYSSSAWGHEIFYWIGGWQLAKLFHRVFAALTLAYVGIHFAYLLKLWRRAPKQSLLLSLVKLVDKVARASCP